MRHSGNVSKRPHRRPVGLSVGQIKSVQTRGAGRVWIPGVGDMSVRVLCHFFEIEVIFEIQPSFHKPFIIIIVFRVRGGVFVLIFNKVEVAPNYQVGEGGEGGRQYIELLSSSIRFVGIEIEIKSVERVGLVFGYKFNTKSPPLQGGRKRYGFMMVKVVQQGGDYRGHAR